MSEMDSEDEECLPTADLDDPVCSGELYLTSTSIYVYMRYPGQQPHPTAQSRSASNPIPPQPDQVEIPLDLMELDIPGDMPDLIDVPEEVISDFDARAQNVLDYPW